MASTRSVKDKEMAAYLKKMGVTRKTGACPWGCGHSITNGGSHLAAHLNICHGPSKRRDPNKTTVAPLKARRIQ